MLIIASTCTEMELQYTNRNINDNGNSSSDVKYTQNTQAQSKTAQNLGVCNTVPLATPIVPVYSASTYPYNNYLNCNSISCPSTWGNFCNNGYCGSSENCFCSRRRGSGRLRRRCR
jgi:hypothetical protein